MSKSLASNHATHQRSRTIVDRFPRIAPGALVYWREKGASFYGTVSAVCDYSVLVSSSQPLGAPIRVFASAIDKVEVRS